MQIRKEVVVINKEQLSLISVIIPVYNAEQFLQQAIDSVVNNGYDNFEIIAVNDGSTDQSLAILRQHASIESRLRVFSVENGGVSRARNIALQYAKGDYIAFLDADDWMMVGTLQEVVSCFDGDTDIVQFPIQRVFEGSVTKRECYTQFRCDSQDEWMKYFFDKSLFRGVWNKLFRRSMLMGLSFREDLRGGEDFMLLLDIVERKGRLFACAKGAIYYRQHAASYCGSPITEKKMRDEALSLGRWCDMASSQPDFKRYIHATKIFLQHTYLQYIQSGGRRFLDIEKDLKRYPPTLKQSLFQVRLRLHLRALAAAFKDRYLRKIFLN